MSFNVVIKCTCSLISRKVYGFPLFFKSDVLNYNNYNNYDNYIMMITIMIIII